MSETSEPGASFGQQQLSTGNNDFNATQFMITQALGRLNTAQLVKVIAVNPPASAVGPVGTVDVLPMVNQLDGANQAVPHGPVYGLPYLRIQGGANAVIVDPQVGDIGIAVFAQNDISSVKASKAPANPGSARKFDMADGLYFGGTLNAAPERYMWIADDGVHIEGVAAVTIHGDNTTVTCNTAAITATASISLTAPIISLNGVIGLNGPVGQTNTGAGSGVVMQGPVNVANDVTAGGKSLISHTHGGVEPGGGNSGPPN